MRDGEHRFGDLAIGVFDEEGQIVDARESGVVVRDLERDSLVGGRDVGDPRFDGLRLRLVAAFAFAALFALFGAGQDGDGIVGQAVVVVIGDAGFQIVDAVAQVGADRREDSAGASRICGIGAGLPEVEITLRKKLQ